MPSKILLLLHKYLLTTYINKNHQDAKNNFYGGGFPLLYQ